MPFSASKFSNASMPSCRRSPSCTGHSCTPKTRDLPVFEKACLTPTHPLAQTNAPAEATPLMNCRLVTFIRSSLREKYVQSQESLIRTPFRYGEVTADFILDPLIHTSLISCLAQHMVLCRCKKKPPLTGPVEANGGKPEDIMRVRGIQTFIMPDSRLAKSRKVCQ